MAILNGKTCSFFHINLELIPLMENSLENLTTIRDLVRWTASEFKRSDIFLGHGTDNCLDEALALVMHVLALDYSLPDQYLDCHLSVQEKHQIVELAKKRISTRKPLSYLTGRAFFAGLEFIVSEQVLVPRSPIADLIENAFYPWIEPDRVNSVLDLCTGSGCIGIASAYALPHAQILLSDISQEALSVAQQNIALHHLEDQVTAIKSDVFSDIPAQQFDLIVSNPPYVSEQEYSLLPDEYHQEPKLGLTAGADGMDIVARILKQSASFLSTMGIIIVEVGASADLLMQRYPNVDFNWIEFERGGGGVFMLSRQELEQYRTEF